VLHSQFAQSRKQTARQRLGQAVARNRSILLLTRSRPRTRRSP